MRAARLLLLLFFFAKMKEKLVRSCPSEARSHIPWFSPHMFFSYYYYFCVLLIRVIVIIIRKHDSMKSAIYSTSVVSYQASESQTLQEQQPVDNGCIPGSHTFHEIAGQGHSAIHSKRFDSYFVQPRLSKNVLFRGSGVVITTALLESVTGLSLPLAARTVGVSSTTFKHVCRHFGIKRWKHMRGKGKRVPLVTPEKTAALMSQADSSSTEVDARPNRAATQEIGCVSGFGRMSTEWEDARAVQPAMPGPERIQDNQAACDWLDGFAAESATAANDRLVLDLLSQPW